MKLTDTEPLFDDDGTEWMDRHAYERSTFPDALADAVLYAMAVVLWLALLIVTV